jgi:formylglycine-generating enzyme required for sulfatase activity
MTCGRPRNGNPFGVPFLLLVALLVSGCASGSHPVAWPAAKRAVTVYQDWPFDKEEALRRQRETAQTLGLPVEKDVDLGGGVMLRLVLIPAGRFIMGSPFSELYRDRAGASGETRHEVTITRPYYLGKYELTQDQWQVVMGDNPSTFKGPGYPVETVGWIDAVAFCEKAAGALGLTIRLPTEAEWEFACRAGTTEAFGESVAVEALDGAGWHGGNSGARLHRVGEKAPNRWGLYDMRGNVWEWCRDWFAPFLADSVTDPRGPAQGEDRVLRGGCWRNSPHFCRSAARDFDSVEDRSGFVGFRVAMEAIGNHPGLHQAAGRASETVSGDPGRTGPANRLGRSQVHQSE